MDEWTKVLLRDVAEVITKGTTPTTVGYRFTDSGVNFIKSESITFHGSIDRTKFAFIDMKTHEALKRSRLSEGDILFSMAGVYIGKTAVVPSQILPANTNQAVGIIRLNQLRALPRFIDFYLRNPTYNQFLNNLVAQSAQPNLNLTEIGNLPINLPPLPEQRAIAHILGTLDDKIELNRRMNETLEQMARAIFKSWFMDFDPVRAKAEGRQPHGMDADTAALFPDSFEDSELGKIPRGWGCGTLGDIAENLRIGIEPDELQSDTPYIGLEHMPRQSIALSEWDTSQDVASNKSVFEKGQILFGKLRPYFHKVGIAPVNGICSTDILVIRPKESIWFATVLYHCSSDELIQYADATSTGTKMPRANWKDLSKYQIVVPPNDIGDAFNEVVEPMSEMICANIHQSLTIGETRDALIPKLLSGDIRVGH